MFLFTSMSLDSNIQCIASGAREMGQRKGIMREDLTCLGKQNLIWSSKCGFYLGQSILIVYKFGLLFPSFNRLVILAFHITMTLLHCHTA